jgi:hypothetical protein
MSNDIFREIVKQNADLYRKNEEYRLKNTNEPQNISIIKKDEKTLTDPKQTKNKAHE